MHIDSETVLFILDQPGKKETTNRFGLHVFFYYRIGALFQNNYCKFQRMALDKKLSLPWLVKLLCSQTTNHC